jgi:hypothetical protein
MASLICLSGIVAGGLVGHYIAKKNESTGYMANIVNVPVNAISTLGMAVVGGLSAVLIKDVVSLRKKH